MRRRETSDESYIITLCDGVLGLKGLRQYKFGFLVGDANKNGTARRLPVDAFYPSLQLVVEYRERQHTESVLIFDKPDRLTISGVHRGEQRKIYDQRRRDLLPKHGIALVEISVTDFKHDKRHRLLRIQTEDIVEIRRILEQWLPNTNT